MSAIPQPQQPGGRAGRRGAELAVVAIFGLLFLAGLVLINGLAGSAETPESRGSSTSSGPSGTLALYRWLERSGFDVQRVEGGNRFPPDADTLFMIYPNEDFPTGQTGSVRRWVEEGHTLILTAVEGGGLGGQHPMLEELGIGLSFAQGVTDTVPLAQPLFTQPRVEYVKMPSIYGLELPISNTLVLASTKSEGGERIPLAAMLKVGSGQIFVLSSDYPLSNIGLGDESDGAFVYNMVQSAGGKRVAFDEAHHGVSKAGDLVALVTGYPWGWALLYAVALAGIYILWSARRLGPPLPIVTPDQRRPTSEYVTAVANLFRRARKPGYAAERYLQFFRRTLAQHAELDPYLADAQFVQALSERGRYSFNTDEMLHALEHLRQLAGVGEGRPASESVEDETLRAIRNAERVRKQALGLRSEAG